MSRHPPRWALFACTLLMQASARAQPLPDPSRELELIESTEANEDPLSLDESTGAELDRAAARIPKPAPPALPSAHTGEALSAIDGVEERAHRVSIRLEAGLAFVDVQLTFGSRAAHAAELAYRLPLPAGAVVTRAARCEDAACEDAAPSAGVAIDAVPVAARTLVLAPIADARGSAAALRASPLAPKDTLTLRVSYVAPAPLRGGRVRFVLPARGYDPRVAEAEVRIAAPGLAELTPGATTRIDATRPLLVTAALRGGAGLTSTAKATCGRHACSRRIAQRAPTPPVDRATWLWIDASPSMEGPPRGRADAVITALLSVLPEDTRVRAFAFAARAVDVGHFRAASAPVKTLADATLQSLDAATRPSSVLALAGRDLARERPRILVISDGDFDPTPSEHAALAEAKRQGAEPWLLHVGDEASRLATAFEAGQVLELASLAEQATRDGTLEALMEALQAVAAPLRGGVRAGEQLVVEQAPRSGWPLRGGAHWLTFWLARAQPAPSFVRGVRPEGSVIAAVPFESAPPPRPAAATGMPKESVLSMLRTQLVPAARACLRSDRQGRADYAVELTFHALFRAREVYDARVEGALPAALRGCLEQILPRLRVPAFSGRIRVHYPVHTEREAPPPLIELEPDVARDVARALTPRDALP